jgi:hypothetical protein
MADKSKIEWTEATMSGPVINGVKLSDDLAAALRQLGCKLPFAHHPEQCGEIVDAAGRSIAVVDVSHDFEDEQAEVIAAIIIFAVNTCAELCAGNDHAQHVVHAYRRADPQSHQDGDAPAGLADA